MDKKERLMSLDALRGFDMLWIMGLSGAVGALCALAGARDGWLAQQMTHVPWEGFRHHDTIFPLFLFLAGASWPFSCAAQLAKGRTRAQITLRVLNRMVLLICFGLVINGLLKFDFAHLRIPSVLGFIGMSWAGAALLYLYVRRTSVRIVITVVLAVGYWALLRFVPAPDAADGATLFSYGNTIANWVDRTLFGTHIIGKGDPEGILSVLCGIVTGCLGVFSGELVRSTRLSGGRKALFLALFVVLLLALGFAWQPWCLCVKKLWSPTFALFSGAYSVALFALFYWLCDVWMWRGWTFPLRVIGMNSITIYLLMRFVGFSGISGELFGGVASWCNADGSRLVVFLGQVFVEWLVLWYLYRKNTFLKV